MALRFAASRPAVRPARGVVKANASLAKVAQAAGIAASSLLLTAAAAHSYAVIKLGSDSGELVFEPSSVSIKAGELIEFVNNRGFPHNVVFDEYEVPDGVDAGALSYSEYMIAEGDTHKVQLTTKGTYGVYCEPHQGAGMKATITVN